MFTFYELNSDNFLLPFNCNAENHKLTSNSTHWNWRRISSKQSLVKSTWPNMNYIFILLRHIIYLHKTHVNWIGYKIYTEWIYQFSSGFKVSLETWHFHTPKKKRNSFYFSKSNNFGFPFTKTEDWKSVRVRMCYRILIVNCDYRLSGILEFRSGNEGLSPTKVYRKFQINEDLYIDVLGLHFGVLLTFNTI